MTVPFKPVEGELLRHLLRRRRLELGLVLWEVANPCGIYTRDYHRFEQGLRLPTEKYLDQILLVLNIPEEEAYTSWNNSAALTPTHRRKHRGIPICGTPGGRSAHYDRGEKPCDVCKAAYSMGSDRKGTTERTVFPYVRKKLSTGQFYYDGGKQLRGKFQSRSGFNTAEEAHEARQRIVEGL